MSELAGKPAHPTTTVPNHAQVQGMTYREWLAGMALQGFIACESQDWHCANFKDRAELAVKQADALIAELEKKK